MAGIRGIPGSCIDVFLRFLYTEHDAGRPVQAGGRTVKIRGGMAHMRNARMRSMRFYTIFYCLPALVFTGLVAYNNQTVFVLLSAGLPLVRQVSQMN